MTKPIVVGTDGSPPAERAVEWAATEAERRGRRLHIVYAVRSPEPGSVTGIRRGRSPDDAREHVLARAAEIAAKTSPNVAVTTEPVSDAPTSALRERAGRASEIVVGHRGRSGIAELLHGSTGLSLAGRTPCPLVIVRGELAEERHEVLAGVDPYDGESERVLAYAFETASQRAAWVRAVYTWEVPPTLFNGAYPATVRQALTAAQSRLGDAVAPWRTRYPKVRVIEETPPGRPMDALVERSSRADLLVVGSSRHGAGLRIGSVGDAVIHHAACPVVVLGVRATVTV